MFADRAGKNGLLSRDRFKVIEGEPLTYNLTGDSDLGLSMVFKVAPSPPFEIGKVIGSVDIRLAQRPGAEAAVTRTATCELQEQDSYIEGLFEGASDGRLGPAMQSMVEKAGTSDIVVIIVAYVMR